MMKTKSWSTFDGQARTTTYKLIKHNVGHPTEWWGIVYHTFDGKNLKNKWGGNLDFALGRDLLEKSSIGHTNNGKPAYIQKIWNTL